MRRRLHQLNVRAACLCTLLLIVLLLVPASQAQATLGFDDVVRVPIPGGGDRSAYLSESRDILWVDVRFDYAGPDGRARMSLPLARRAAIVEAQRDVLLAAAAHRGFDDTPVSGTIGRSRVIREHRVEFFVYRVVFAARYSSVSVRPCLSCDTTEVQLGGP